MPFLKRKRSVIVAACAGVVIIVYALLVAPPLSFPSGKVIVVSRGASVPAIASQLAETHIVSHAVILRGILRVLGAGTVQAGAYQFAKPESVISVAYRLKTGDYGIPPARITINEGLTAREIAKRVADALPEIAESDMRALAVGQEGYLFPDTYIFPPGADAEQVVKTMRDNFDAKFNPLLPEVRASGHSISEVVTMASLLEKEARTIETMKIIAGILWHRRELGMPLQVDAVFGYIFNRDTYSPSFADLKTNSPYNTYTHTGLPPGPICNPGLESLIAALNPTRTPYLYYLTGRDGTMHYASTYAGHLNNQRKYLP